MRRNISNPCEGFLAFFLAPAAARPSFYQIAALGGSERPGNSENGTEPPQCLGASVVVFSTAAKGKRRQRRGGRGSAKAQALVSDIEDG
jgi:hypothetical protein